MTGAVTYEIQVDDRTTSTANVIREAGLTGTSFTPTTALADGTYRVWIRAISSTTTGPWSVQFDFVVAASDVDESSQSPPSHLASVQLLNEAIEADDHLPAPTPSAAVAERDEASRISAVQDPKHREMTQLDEQFAVAQEWLSIV